MAQTVVLLTTAAMGVGKTYCRGPVFVATEWLPFHSGQHVSNLPLFPDKIAAYCKRRYKDDYRAEQRIRRIPEEVFQKWIEPEGVAGPWDFFGTDEWPLAGTHIAIDEAHLCIPRVKCVQRRRLWNAWLAEIRHAGATIEFISQHIDRMDEDVRKVCSVRITLTPRDSDRDPIFGIQVADWYELKALLTREWNPCVVQFEKRQTDTKWETVQRKRIELSSTFYALYDSYSKPMGVQTESGEVVADVAGLHEFQKRSFFGVLWWFWRRNWGYLGKAACLTVGVIWLCFFGGITFALNALMAFMPGGGGVADVAAVEGSETAGETVEGVSLGLDPAWDFETVLYRMENGEGEIEEYTIGDFGYLVYGREEAEMKVNELEEKVQTMEAKSGHLIMMGANWVQFSGGERVAVNEKVQANEFSGLYLRQVDFRKRRALLSDGRFIYLRVPELDDGASRFGGAGLSVGGDGAAGRGADVAASPGNGRAVNDGGRRGEPGAVSADGRPGDGS